MDLIQLKRILETYSMTKHSFQGVYASDQLKQIQTPVYFLASSVINEDPSTKGESHWIALYIGHQTEEYFDRYGQPPIPSIKKFIQRLSQQHVSHNEKTIAKFSNTKLWSVLYFLFDKKQEGSSLEKMIKHILLQILPNC